MELIDAILERRSIRNYSDYYVTDEEVREVIEAARWAPSWANTQVWEFIVVRDRAIIKQVTETYTETNPARKCSFTSSAIIVVCAKKKISGCKGGMERTKFFEWFMFDLGMAVQNLSLRAHDLGLGTVVVGNLKHDECSKILHVPDEYEVVAAVPIGKPAESKESQRKALKEFVYLNRFGEKFG